VRGIQKGRGIEAVRDDGVENARVSVSANEPAPSISKTAASMWCSSLAWLPPLPEGAQPRGAHASRSDRSVRWGGHARPPHRRFATKAKVPRVPTGEPRRPGRCSVKITKHDGDHHAHHETFGGDDAERSVTGAALPPRCRTPGRGAFGRHVCLLRARNTDLGARSPRWRAAAVLCASSARRTRARWNGKHQPGVLRAYRTLWSGIATLATLRGIRS
jgi:hypothetical protein